jgi:hypothetical protein
MVVMRLQTPPHVGRPHVEVALVCNFNVKEDFPFCRLVQSTRLCNASSYTRAAEVNDFISCGDQASIYRVRAGVVEVF